MREPPSSPWATEITTRDGNVVMKRIKWQMVPISTCMDVGGNEKMSGRCGRQKNGQIDRYVNRHYNLISDFI